MSEWKECKVEDFCEVIGGGTPSTKEESYYGGSFSWITPRDLTNHKNRLISKGERNITELGLRNSSARMLPKNSILLTSRAPIGYLAIAENEVCTNQGFKSLIVNPEKADYNFVYYLIKSNVERIKGLGTGTTFAEISGSVVKNLKFFIPSLPTQTAIAEILSSLDDKIELNNKINQELEALAQTLFKQWFIDFEFPNENGESYKSSGGEMVESELGEIPKGWEVATIDDISEIVTKGTTPTSIGGKFTESGINFIKVESLTESGTFIKSKFAHIDDETNQLLKRSIIKSGDVLFSIAGTIGRVAVVTDEILPANTNQAIAIIRPKKISSYFLKILMQSSLIQNDTQSNIVQAVQANLSLGVMKATKFILPSTNILSMIDIQLDSIYDNINHISLENENLTTLRDTLLPKLISGELSLNEISNQ
jgi:type I restriction enzyme S subunit